MLIFLRNTAVVKRSEERLLLTVLARCVVKGPVVLPITMNKPVKVEGLAHLCFLPNGRFTGRVVGPADHQYAIVGGADYCCGPDDPHDHKCCYEDSCKLRDLTVMDYEGFGESTLIPRVLQSGGDNCSLTSKNVKFITDQLITGKKAEEYIEKYFQAELLGKDCYVCVGNMQISFPEPLVEEDK
ncbi:hypothetical protein BaRGS_00025227 [Batillaria attramentaria]|uniref:Phospholipid scramblase n=1 Tax=Batillaria attramentaria TaxID=370345 RepID=A0ABD0K8Z8_9CAEN